MENPSLFEAPAVAIAPTSKRVGSPSTKAKVNTAVNQINDIQKKLKLVYQNATELKGSQINEVSFIVTNFLNGKDIDLQFSFGGSSRILSVVIRALATIYINTNDIGLQIRIKQNIKKSLNPLDNPIFAKKIIEIYNQSKLNKFPIKKIDKAVTWALNKSFEYNFETYWDYFIRKSIGPNKTFITGNFVGLVYDGVTGSGGFRERTWFGQYYNEYKSNPEMFSIGGKTQDPLKQKLDRSNHTVSDVIQYVYSVGKKFNPKIIDNFNAANQEIVDWLKANTKNNLIPKVFEYIVINKLDSEEIMSIDKSFKTNALISGTFNDLTSKNKKAVQAIDAIYKKYKLNLPSFSKWKSSDFNKGPSDRGELEYTGPEIGVDKKGNLSKINWDKTGEKTYTPLQELRLLIRNTINEYINQNNNVI